MNVFGPRKEDPLLQNDPFALPSDHQASADDAPLEEPLSSKSGNEASESRLLLGSKTDAQEGRLTPLNRALENGWTLECIELRPADTLAFVLGRLDAESEN